MKAQAGGFFYTMQLLYIFLGGGLGALLRYGAALAAGSRCGSALPGTLAVNVLGSLVLGFVFGLVQHRPGCVSEELRLFISTGLLGALTTFSTLNWEVFSLLKSGRAACGLSYLALSCVLGLASAAGGYYLAKQVC